MAHLHDAEALSRRCFHHPPPLHERDLLRPECFEASRLGIDVVGFDVEVDSGRTLKNTLLICTGLSPCGLVLKRRPRAPVIGR
jgi:hypothetical protein